MPKQNGRERLNDLEARQRKLTEELAAARVSLRDRYAAMVADTAVETVSERDFRDVLRHLVRIGGPASIAALKAAPGLPPVDPPNTKRVAATNTA